MARALHYIPYNNLINHIMTLEQFDRQKAEDEQLINPLRWVWARIREEMPNHEYTLEEYHHIVNAYYPNSF